MGHTSTQAEHKPCTAYSMKKMGGGGFAASPIFWILGVVHLWPVLWAVHGLRTAYVWPIYGLCMTYIWPIYGPTFICGKFGTFTSASVFEHAHLWLVL